MEPYGSFFLTAQRYARQAEVAEQSGHWQKAFDKHQRAAKEFNSCLFLTTHPSAVEALQLVTERHLSRCRELSNLLGNPFHSPRLPSPPPPRLDLYTTSVTSDFSLSPDPPASSAPEGSDAPEDSVTQSLRLSVTSSTTVTETRTITATVSPTVFSGEDTGVRTKHASLSWSTTTTTTTTSTVTAHSTQAASSNQASPGTSSSRGGPPLSNSHMIPATADTQTSSELSMSSSNLRSRAELRFPEQDLRSFVSATEKLCAALQQRGYDQDPEIQDIQRQVSVQLQQQERFLRAFQRQKEIVARKQKSQKLKQQQSKEQDMICYLVHPEDSEGKLGAGSGAVGKAANDQTILDYEEKLKKKDRFIQAQAEDRAKLLDLAEKLKKEVEKKHRAVVAHEQRWKQLLEENRTKRLAKQQHKQRLRERDRATASSAKKDTLQAKK